MAMGFHVYWTEEQRARIAPEFCAPPPDIEGVVRAVDGGGLLLEVLAVSEGDPEVEMRRSRRFAVYQKGSYKGEAISMEFKGSLLRCEFFAFRDAIVEVGDFAATNAEEQRALAVLPDFDGVVVAVDRMSLVIRLEKLQEGDFQQDPLRGDRLAVYRDSVYKGEAVVVEVDGRMLRCRLSAWPGAPAVVVGDRASTNP